MPTITQTTSETRHPRPGYHESAYINEGSYGVANRNTQHNAKQASQLTNNNGFHQKTAGG